MSLPIIDSYGHNFTFTFLPKSINNFPYVPRLPDGLKFLDIICLIWWPNNYCCQSTQGLVIIFIILYILNGFSTMGNMVHL